MQRCFSALDDAITQRQWRQTPRTRSLVIPRPRGPARRPAQGSSGGSHAALGAAPRPPRSWNPHRRRLRSRACGRTGACLVAAASTSRSAAVSGDVTAPRREAPFPGALPQHRPLPRPRQIPGHEPEAAAPGPRDPGAEEAAGPRACGGRSFEGRCR